jgi:small glutamine-rich tetratricopeptide repeat-containing protein alpha
VKRLEPENRSAAEAIALCSAKVGAAAGSGSEEAEDDSTSDLGAASGGSGFPGFGGGGGMPNISELLGNPGAMSAMMNDPRFAAVAQQVMSNPALMQSVMGMMGGLGGMGGRGPQ